LSITADIVGHGPAIDAGTHRLATVDVSGPPLAEEDSGVVEPSGPEAPGNERAGADEPRAAPVPGSFSARLVATRERATLALDSARGRSRIVDAASAILLRPRLVADTVLAGYLAMRLFILSFPLAYMIVAGLGLLSHGAQDSAAKLARDSGLAPAVTASIADAARSSSRNHWIALIIATGATLWAARGVLRALRALHALAWNIPAPKTNLKPLGPVLTGTAALALLLVSTVTDHLDERGLSWAVAHLVAVGVASGIWLGASIVLPRESGPWYGLVPGAVLFGIGLQGLVVATAVYFSPKATSASAAYGALGLGLVLLSWLVALGWIVTLSAEVNAGLADWWHRQRR
jgi:uncharacterized BrkB/YihY/UPF0761 family membrane protein